jgi:hypothetical protein
MRPSEVQPERHEAGEYYFKYIDLVPVGDICATLAGQRAEALAFFRGIPEGRAGHRYEPGKWSINAVLAHINDCERLFAFRAFWFARGFDTPLPSFDQEVADRNARADDRSWSSHIEEFDSLRASTLDFFSHLSPEAWLRSGTASGNPFSVRALAFIAAGHVIHHNRILKERYL